MNGGAAAADGKQGKELPAVTVHRAGLLNLPLSAYKQHQDRVERGFIQAAKFLHTLHIYRIFDLPYQSQVVPLAAILADVGEGWSHEGNRARLVQWYWNGVFGELYGAAVESRIARDFMEVPNWLKGGATPSTIVEATFWADRLKTMRMRISAAYKGVNALLMKEGAQDFRSGQRFDHAIFFGESVDIHHIFPRSWCESRGIPPAIFDSILNKTPLSYRTNRIIGGGAHSTYIARLEAGDAQTPPITPANLDAYLRSHLIEPSLLRADDFQGFMKNRQQQLLHLIERATCRAINEAADGEQEIDSEGDTAEADLTMAAADLTMAAA